LQEYDDGRRDSQTKSERARQRPLARISVRG
jgi:hypothetical protein